MIGRIRTLSLSLVAALPAVSLVVAQSAFAATVDFKFEPPEVPSKTICAVREPDARVLGRWKAWDAKSLKGWDPVLVRSEIRRLREIDGAAWFDKIDAAIALLPTIDPAFSDDHAAIERIEAMLSAGKLRDLQAAQLVPQLLQRNHGDSPRVQLALSRYLTLGQGIDRDPERGLELLLAAAMGGNADALLELVAMQTKGEAVPGWDLSPELGVTMAFGALVGKLDASICDRVTRIAREYKNGDIVSRDMTLSERWYLFAADLGDTDAAWKVAEFHMKSEDIVKDNVTLVKYLTRAADGGAPFAIIALGRIYEIGALVPQDRDHARALYERAAGLGDRGALIRLVQLLGTMKKVRPGLEAVYQKALTQLVTRDD
ncbi:MAG: tetratricopeptide repeat protein, partial [Deltaproteobacteria bacterium]